MSGHNHPEELVKEVQRLINISANTPIGTWDMGAQWVLDRVREWDAEQKRKAYKRMHRIDHEGGPYGVAEQEDA